MESAFRNPIAAPANAAGKAIDMEQVKSLELGVLDAFAGFCDQHELTWWLGYGTLLGAVRHQGFIPWDDDIDLIMPDKDYYRLIELVNSGQSIGDHYRASEPGIRSETFCHTPFMKVYDTRTSLIENELVERLKVDEGVWVDIFPLHGLPDDPQEIKRLQDRFYWLYVKARLASFKRNPGGSLAGSLARTLLKIPTLIKGCRYYLDVMDSLSKQLPTFASSERVFAPVEPSKIFKRSSFDETVMLEFEGRQYPAPAGYDAHLTEEYGDYMQLPPEDKRVPLHDFDVYWR